ncbi:glucose-6-phosphate dehydrogenase [Geopsychrobacter electrodiphilus]|uniref:glucose-6-phosphate dehydrogenase n=1 Tax=Geopsychrobacter electrodiphilus TaxID=225196 RepID=UPI0003740E11|nr:glucose-6-phosphate dehydrogenase [Geopsychrobacter electrodiphilus]
MERNNQPQPTVFVIFGASGDLAWRKLIPALYNLYLDDELPKRLAILGIGRKAISDEEFRAHLRDGVDQFSRRGKTEKKSWDEFAAHLNYLAGDLAEKQTGTALAEQLRQFDQTWGLEANRIFYLAIPPALAETVAGQLARLELCKDCRRDRLVVEKPFGHDLASARALDLTLTGMFSENQIYRIDHYLGKETVQNLLAFRFANALFEPIWDRRYIDHVQITVAETVGVGSRGGYYEHAGALRDMVQNHLLQILCLIAMESPVSFDADEIRNKKVDVLRAIHPIKPDKVHQYAVRGQYGKGQIGTQKTPGYRQEEGVAPDSSTETFAALRLFIDNWRWQGVPFYLRTGKCLADKVSQVSILFRPVPHQSFPASAVENWQPNRLVIRIQPEEGITLRIQAKQPGTRMVLAPVDMQFCYSDAFNTTAPEAYETLLLDVMRGDATLFMRADQVEKAWEVIAPVLESWTSVPAGDFPDYRPGSWGPEAAAALLTQDGRNWFEPVASSAKCGEQEDKE